MVESERKYITQEDLKKHNIPGDLWISIQDKVYDVSNWVKQHPGGETPLLNLAGNDVTDAFIAYHPGTAWKHLDKLFTGYYLEDFQDSEVSKDYRTLMNEFNKLGLFDNKGHGAFRNFVYIAILFFAVVWGVCCCDSFWIHLASAFLLGLAWVLSAYLGHDSGHYVIMSNKKWNKIAQLITGNCLTGISIAWWKWTHNAHHISCNSLDYDPDLQHIPVFAVSTKFFGSLSSVFYGRKMEFDSVARTLISYQHWTYYPVMIFARINLYIQTFLLLFSKRPVPDRAMNIIGLAVFWIWFPLLISRLPNLESMVMFVVTSFAVTAFQHIQFTLNHFSADVYVGKPVGNDWFQKQTSGTIDISCSSWMDWAFGGLQFQLEHHLFPRLPRCHLRKISPVVQELCKKHDLPYRSMSWFDANVRTIGVLRTAAFQARDLTKGVPKNLIWEAINIHGEENVELKACLSFAHCDTLDMIFHGIIITKRKLEKEFALYGGPLPKGTGESDGEEDHKKDEGSEEDEESDQIPSVSGTRMYDNGDYKVTVTTSAIAQEEEDLQPSVRPATTSSVPGSSAGAKKNGNIPVKKKQLKKVVNQRSRPKLHNKRDRRKGKKSSSNQKRH